MREVKKENKGRDEREKSCRIERTANVIQTPTKEFPKELER